MCGIFAYVGTLNATKIVFNGLKDLEYRGYDSWGIAIEHGQKLKIIKHLGKLGNAKLVSMDSHLAIGHTRWATHGRVTISNTHPHLDCHKQIAVVHNGIVDNYRDLKELLIKQGHNFVSQTDTEVIPHLLENCSSKHQILKVLSQLKGLSTVVILNHQTKSLFAWRNGSPLTVGKNKSGFYISSDIPSLLRHTSQIAIVDDGQFVAIIDGELQTKLTFRHHSRQLDLIDKGSFSHYLLKEIYDQVNTFSTISTIDSRLISKASKIMNSTKHLYLLGCGSAYYAMLATSYFLREVGINSMAVPADEFASYLPIIKKGDVVVLASQSGETIDLVNAMRQAHIEQAKSIALVNVMSSTIAREAALTIPLLAGYEKAVVSTKAFTAKLCLAILLKYSLLEKLYKGRNLLKQSSVVVADILSGVLQTKLTKLAQTLATQEHIFLLGKDIGYPLALEGAMKIKEVSYIHSEGFAAGELKHGVIALIEHNTPVIVFALPGEGYLDTISAAEQVKARGAYVIGIGPIREKIFDDHFKISDIREVSWLSSVVIIQLLGYYLALKLDRDPDMPRNLAKSVTVK